MSDSPFNEILLLTRKERGLSLKEAAEQTGFTQSFVKSYEEYAKNPTVKTLFTFARAYGLRVTIDSKGVSVEDTETESDLLKNWNPCA